MNISDLDLNYFLPLWHTLADYVRQYPRPLWLALVAYFRSYPPTVLAHARLPRAPVFAADHPMTLREWRGRVPRDKAGAYLRYLRRTGLRDYAATPGHLGTWVLLDEGAKESEIVLLSLWDSPQAIRAFAGEDIGRARYYPKDAGFLLAMPQRLRHYQVVTRPGRAAVQCSLSDTGSGFRPGPWRRGRVPRTAGRAALG